MKKIYFLLSFIIVLSSCEQDEIINSEKNATELSSYKMKRLNSLDIPKNHALIKQLRTLSNSKKTSGDKILNIDGLNIAISLDGIIYMEKGEYNSYTFPVKQKGNEKIKNILFNINKEGSYDAFLVEYDYSWEEMKALNPEELSKNISLKSLNIVVEDLTNKKMITRWVCISTYFYYYADGEVAGSYTGLPNWHWAATDCHSVTYDDGGDYSPNYTSSYEENGDTASYTGSVNIATSTANDPTLDEDYLIWLTTLKGELGSRLSRFDKLYLDKHVAVTMQNYNYLKNHKFTEAAKDFSAEAIKSTRVGGIVDFDDTL